MTEFSIIGDIRSEDSYCLICFQVFAGAMVMLRTWERKGVGFLQSRGFSYPAPKRN